MGTAADRWGLVYLVTAQTSSPSALARRSSQYSLLALLISLLTAFLASLTSSFLAAPLLFLRATYPSSLRLARISSFHHLLDLEQMAITRQLALRPSLRCPGSSRSLPRAPPLYCCRSESVWEAPHLSMSSRPCASHTPTPPSRHLLAFFLLSFRPPPRSPCSFFLWGPSP